MLEAEKKSNIKEHNLDPIKIEKKLRLMAGLFHFAYETKKYQLKLKYSHLSEKEINYKAYALIERGCA